MTTQEFLDVVAEALGQAPGSVSPDDTPETLDTWDSVGHLSILSAIEREAGVATNADDLVNAASVRELLDALRARGAVED